MTNIAVGSNAPIMGGFFNVAIGHAALANNQGCQNVAVGVGIHCDNCITILVIKIKDLEENVGVNVVIFNPITKSITKDIYHYKYFNYLNKCYCDHGMSAGNQSYDMLFPRWFELYQIYKELNNQNLGIPYIDIFSLIFNYYILSLDDYRRFIVKK